MVQDKHGDDSKIKECESGLVDPRERAAWLQSRSWIPYTLVAQSSLKWLFKINDRKSKNKWRKRHLLCICSQSMRKTWRFYVWYKSLWVSLKYGSIVLVFDRTHWRGAGEWKCNLGWTMSPNRPLERSFGGNDVQVGEDEFKQK